MAGGRPSKFDQGKIDIFLKTIGDVGTVEDAATEAGLIPDTVFKWLRRGKRSRSGRFRQFFLAYEKAKSTRSMAGERQVRDHGKKDWRATAWLLSVWDPLKYSTKVHRILEAEFQLGTRRIRNAFTKLDQEKPLKPAEAMEVALAALSGEMDGVESANVDPKDEQLGDVP